MSASLNLHNVKDIRVEQDHEHGWYTITFTDPHGNEMLELTAFPPSLNGRALPGLVLEGFAMVPMGLPLHPAQPDQPF